MWMARSSTGGVFFYEEARMQNDAKNTEPAHVKPLHTL